MISLIAAVSTNRVIGNEQELPWRLLADLKHFKRLTMNHHLIMGRRTFESIGKHPLPNREIIVLTRQKRARYRRVKLASSLSEAAELASKDSEIFIAGGSAVYAEALAIADRLYLTWVHTEVEGDRFFPRLAPGAWSLRKKEHRARDPKNRYDMTFLQIEPAQASSLLTAGDVPDDWLE